MKKLFAISGVFLFLAVFALSSCRKPPPPDPCANVECQPNEECVNGKCVPLRNG